MKIVGNLCVKEFRILGWEGYWGVFGKGVEDRLLYF